MAKYMLLFMGAQMESPQPNDPRAQETRKLWMNWMQELGKRGALDSGLPFQNGGKVVGKRSSDYKMKKSDVQGFLVINAGSMDEAMKIAKESPHRSMGGKTVIRACAEMPSM